MHSDESKHAVAETDGPSETLISTYIIFVVCQYSTVQSNCVSVSLTARLTLS